MSSKSPHSDPPDSPSADAAIAEYFRRLDRGEAISQQAFLAEHPDLSEQLTAFFTAAELLESWAGSTRAEELDGGRLLGEEDDVVMLEAVAPHLPSVRYVGRYRILRKIGQGAMGEVFLAHDPQLDRQVALKLPIIPTDESEEMLQRFYREARAAAALQHPNICPIFDVGCEGDQHYISMAYIDGTTLAEKLKQGHRYSAYQATAIARKLALALDHAHRAGVVHRDLKPSNVIIDSAGEPVITDFGLACRMHTDDVRVTQTGAILGSPAYLSPEQIEGRSSGQETLTDIYGLGVIYYELLTGRVPFDGTVASVLFKIVSENPTPPDQREPTVDPVYSRICLKLLAKRPGDRYQPMSEVAEALDEALVPPAANRKEHAADSPIGAEASGASGPDLPARQVQKPPPSIDYEMLDDGDRMLRNTLIASAVGLFVVGTLLLVLGIFFWQGLPGARDKATELADRPADSAPRNTDTSNATSRGDSKNSSNLPPNADRSLSPPSNQLDPNATEIPPIRYRFQADTVYPFEVEVIARLRTSTITLKGTPAFYVEETDELGTTLVLRGGLIPYEESHDGYPFGASMRLSRFGVFSPYSGLTGYGSPGEHRVTVDARGKVTSVRGQSQLPFLLGNLSLLMLDEFPDSFQQEWTASYNTSVETIGSRGHFDFGLPPHLRASPEISPGRKTTTYSIRSHDKEKGRIVLTKKIEMHAAAGGRDYRFEGQGELLFDLHAGTPLKMTLRGQSQSPEFTESIPLTIVYSQVDREQYKQRMAEAAKRAEEARIAREKAEAEARKPVDQAAWSELKTGILTKKDAEVREAANRLRQTEQLEEDLRTEVRATLFRAITAHDDRTTKRELVLAVCRYATTEDLPQLLRLIDHADIALRKAVIERLGELQDARAAQPLAARLSDGFDRQPATEALKKLGPAAEAEVLDVLSHNDRWVRAAVIEILKEIGTEQSLAALSETAVNDGDTGVRSAAGTTVQAIRNRRGS